MPLPFILIGIAAATGLIGGAKGVQAYRDNSKASDINSRATEVFEDAANSLNIEKQKTTQSLESLGRLKLEIWNEKIGSFVDLFGRIKNIELSGNVFSDNKFDAPSPSEMLKMKEISMRAGEVINGGIASLGSGALAGVAAYGGTMMFASASTGTAITALSGVAATNATLAWLGGGSLTAGGMGMAGGMAVLGGIVAGPILFVSGWMLSAKAKEALANARGNLAEARLAAEKMQTACSALCGIRKIVDEFTYVIMRVVPIMDHTLTQLRSILSIMGEDYGNYSPNQKENVRLAVEVAGLMKKLLEMPIMTESGALRLTVGKEIEECKDKLNSFTNLHC